MSTTNITYLTDVALLTCVVPAGVSDVVLKTALGVSEQVFLRNAEILKVPN